MTLDKQMQACNMLVTCTPTIQVKQQDGERLAPLNLGLDLLRS
jgi:hypothetical protein